MFLLVYSLAASFADPYASLIPGETREKDDGIGRGELYQRVISAGEIKQQWNLEHVYSGFAIAPLLRTAFALHSEFIRPPLPFPRTPGCVLLAITLGSIMQENLATYD